MRIHARLFTGFLPDNWWRTATARADAKVNADTGNSFETFPTANDDVDYRSRRRARAWSAYLEHGNGWAAVPDVGARQSSFRCRSARLPALRRDAGRCDLQELKAFGVS